LFFQKNHLIRARGDGVTFLIICLIIVLLHGCTPYYMNPSYSGVTNSVYGYDQTNKNEIYISMIADVRPYRWNMADQQMFADKDCTIPLDWKTLISVPGYSIQSIGRYGVGDLGIYLVLQPAFSSGSVINVIFDRSKSFYGYYAGFPDSSTEFWQYNFDNSNLQLTIN